MRARTRRGTAMVKAMDVKKDGTGNGGGKITTPIHSTLHTNFAKIYVSQLSWIFEASKLVLSSNRVYSMNPHHARPTFQEHVE